MLITTLILILILLASEANSFSLSSSKPPVSLPTSQDAMIRQAASAISTALLVDGIHLQTIRLPLSEAMYSQSEEGFVADRAIGWQGGPQETYRYLAPIVRQLLQTIDTTTAGAANSGLLPRIQEQILLDFDGSALLTSESPEGALGDAQAILQPGTDTYYPKTIKQIESQLIVQVPSSNSSTKEEETKQIRRLFLLVNPGWRDASSFGFFSQKQAQKEILDRYETTYAVDQFVVRGLKCSVVKVWPHDWCVYASNLPYDITNSDNDEDQERSPAFLGSFSERPPYKVIDELILSALKKKKST